MIRDLSDMGSPEPILHTDVAIIGGGIAGLTLANRLRDRGISCVVVESGGLNGPTGEAFDDEVSFITRRYEGALSGRTRGLGGTSAKWGGALLPFLAKDLKPRPLQDHLGWPISHSALEPYTAEVEKLFGLDGSPYEDRIEMGQGTREKFISREAKWPPFRRRNMYSLFASQLRKEHGVEVWINATATQFITQGAKLVEVHALDEAGRKLKVAAQRFVFCAGAIETTRLLLLLHRQSGGVAVRGHKHLGLYLQDHISAPLAVIKTKAPEALNEFAAFRFERRNMRSLRFETTEQSLVNGFVHIAPRSLKPTGFDAVKTFMRSVQLRRPDFVALGSAMSDFGYLASLLRWRLFKKRLLWPVPSDYEVHFVIEQPASSNNSITLGKKLDKYGRPVALIDWNVGGGELLAFKEICGSFEEYWRDKYQERYGPLDWPRQPNFLEISDVLKAGDIFHPVGTTRMATCPEDGVVDENLKVFGLSNLYLSSTSTFPNAGSANPTMTLMMMTLRLAEHLSNLRE